MNHNSKSDKFIFNFPSEFIPKELEKKYSILLQNMHKPYNTVLDYINSNILDVNLPGLRFDSVEQTKFYGKKRTFKSGKSPYDAYNRELNINIKNADFHIVYFIIHDALLYHYINTSPFLTNFSVKILDDEYRELFELHFSELVVGSQSDIRLGHQLKEENLEIFTVNFKYNFLDIELIPKWDVEKDESGDIDEKYYDRLIENDPDNDPNNNYPNDSGCDEDSNNHPEIKS